jgi:hypothetical protein
VDDRERSGRREIRAQADSGRREVLQEDDDDLTVCNFDLKHRAEGVPATRILSYGPDDFMPACAECAAFFEQTT